MKAGYKALMRSAEIPGLDELEEELAREKAAKKAAKNLLTFIIIALVLCNYVFFTQTPGR